MFSEGVVIKEMQNWWVFGKCSIFEFDIFHEQKLSYKQYWIYKKTESRKQHQWESTTERTESTSTTKYPIIRSKQFFGRFKGSCDSVVSMILELKFLFHQSIEMFLLNAIFYNAVSMNTISINNRNPSRRC